MHNHWITNPKHHTKPSTSILVVICNTIGIVDTRFMAIGDGPNRKTAASLTMALRYEWKQLIRRPKRTLHENYIGNLSGFI